MATALIPDWSGLYRPGSVDKVIAAPSPESRDPSTGARVTIEVPEIIESATVTSEVVAPESDVGTAPETQPEEGASGTADATPQGAAADENPAPQADTPAADSNAADSNAANSGAPDSNAAVTDDVYASGAEGAATWLRNSVAFSVPHGHPTIAIVLDDVGVNHVQAEQAIDLPPEITLSFMTYASHVAEMSARARARGHELMVHVPMEPLSAGMDPGPNALKVSLSDSELLARLRWGLDRFDGYVGVNNHMGSRFTQSEHGMRLVLAELKRRNLLFLDSRTIGGSVGNRLAAEMGVAHVTRDVFLDDDMSGSAVLRQLAVAERVARANGQAIAIGHPHPATIAAIRAWLPLAKARGFVIVPLSVVAKQQLGATG